METPEAPKERFTGHELDDETGLLYAGARYLDPVIGRWMGVDPLADEYPDWSPYHYAANNPLTITDPTGMDWYCTTNDDGDCTGYQWDDDLTAENASERLGEGQKYIAFGTTYTAYNGLTVQLGENQFWSYLDTPESVTARVASGQLDGDLLAANANSLPLELQAAIGAGIVHRGQAEFLNHPVTQATITGLSFLVGGGVARTATLARGHTVAGKYGSFTVHALQRGLERGVSRRMMVQAQRNGRMFWDPKNRTLNFVLENALPNGRSVLVGQSVTTGRFTTTFTGRRLIRSRLIPLR